MKRAVQSSRSSLIVHQLKLDFTPSNRIEICTAILSSPMRVVSLSLLRTYMHEYT